VNVEHENVLSYQSIIGTTGIVTRGLKKYLKTIP
jgi:hypothetical protein